MINKRNFNGSKEDNKEDKGGFSESLFQLNF
jgi:hypothetical protein